MEDAMLANSECAANPAHSDSDTSSSRPPENALPSSIDQKAYLTSVAHKSLQKKALGVPDLPHNVSKSRTVRFRKLFKSIPIDEYPIESFSCAFKGDILLQGQMYVSHNWVCFYSKIKARGRLMEIPFKRVISITREKLALFIPNAIGIQTADQKYVFGSFITRDSTYKKLVTLWKFSQDSISGTIGFSSDPLARVVGHPTSGDSSETDTTEDEVTDEPMDRPIGMASDSGPPSYHRMPLEPAKEPPIGLLPPSSPECVNCKHIFKTFCTFSVKLQRIPRTNMLLAICSILVFFLMLSAIGLTYKILLLQSRLEVGSRWAPKMSSNLRDRAMSNLYWLQTETHVSTIRRLHSVLEANVHLLEEVNVLLQSLHREPSQGPASCSNCAT